MAEKTLAETIELKIRAGIPGLIGESFEHEDFIEEVRRVCCDPENQWQLATFDLDQGMMVCEPAAGGRYIWVPRWFKETATEDGYSYNAESGHQTDAAQVIKGMAGLNHGKTRGGDDEDEEPSEVPGILVMKNHMRWLTTPALVQLVANRLWENKQKRLHIVLLSPATDLPIELDKLFESGHIRHRLPDREQILEIIETSSNEDDRPEDIEPVIDSVAGLTRMGVEDACSLSIVEHGSLIPKEMFRVKAEAFEKSSDSIEIFQGDTTLDDYGGSPHLKALLLDLLGQRETNPKFMPNGIFLVGPGGVGKSYLAECLGNTVNRPTLICQMARTKSKWQGESGKNFRSMLDIMEATAPNICMLDEVEGQVAGGKDTGAIDGGTKSESNSEMLRWLDKKLVDAFVIAACNDIRPILRDMPEFARLGRFDAMIFLDYPDRASKDAIWKIQLVIFEQIDPEGDIDKQFADMKDKLPKDENWTGAEIEACCMLARKRHKPLKEIAAGMSTIDKMANEKIDAIREWADGICSSAEYEGLYIKDKHRERLAAMPSANGGSRRKVTRRRRVTKPGEN